MNQPFKIQLETVIIQTTGLVAADLDGEKAMMSVEKGKYYGLDATGSCIWELIAKPVTVKEVIEALMDQYDVDETTCQKDVLVFLNKMVDEGLVSIV
ncbi:lasso peptide biosynthesis PqqD family chaperone [Candidatus Formimonas warabiya]|uniref:Pyrroloquinoline quinone biosynthesis protein n=1 Tax=Formimonas warabiya TaxID=1761012 RepID=A0A3G1L056_FORW1|nr:lasso peptide biosynthesis PqqD family chaperone [Candidatus Formimonas warabiya]ATW28172.1 pyrroloquinoline quinone biosynthesis protein [Candidatus Formimonas warabiya]